MKAKDRAHKRRFSASVLSDNAKIVARVDVKVELLNENVFVVAKAKVLAFQERHSEYYRRKRRRLSI